MLALRRLRIANVRVQRGPRVAIRGSRGVHSLTVIGDNMGHLSSTSGRRTVWYRAQKAGKK
jgi:hypothetical protein